MDVPETSALYNHILACMSDGKLYEKRNVSQAVAERMQLPEEVLEQRYESTGLRIFTRRVLWALDMMMKTGLVERPAFATYCLTEEGRKQANLTKAKDELAAFPPNTAGAQSLPSDSRTPEDKMAEARDAYDNSLADELLLQIMKQTPAFFEHLVVDLLEKMGYAEERGNAAPNKPTPANHDGGLDAIFYEDRLGFNAIYVQAKQWQKGNNVHSPDVQKFIGALNCHPGATKGLFITTSDFSSGAAQVAQKQHQGKIVLVNGRMLVQLMMEYGLGVSSKTYTLRSLDWTYFNPDGE